MSPMLKSIDLKNQGAVLIISLIFIAVFSALAVSMVTMSGNNVQLAENQQKSDCARACAESGFDVIRYWLNRVSISGTIEPSERCSQFAYALQNELYSQGITNITVSYNSSEITIQNVTLDSETNSSFSTIITPLDNDTLQVEITGYYGSMSYKIRGNYYFSERGNTVFDFGVASKGPLSLTGNVDLESVNLAVEASVYIESENSNLALSITGNSQIAGDVKIVNSIATVDLQGGKAGIGGETGQDAIDNHVDFGVPPSEFPEPVPGQFESYATNIVDANTDTSSNATFENIKILANTNPTFSGNATLKGVIYIETPNVVEFTGGADVTGIIVGDGDITDNSGVNQLKFTGNVDSHPISELPEEAQFDELRDKTGTFIMAPGFSTSFGGNFSALCGAIAANGIEFHGNAGGIINGSVINYSDELMTLSGNTDLYFNRSGITEAPAGFVPETILQFHPESYSEVML